MKEALKLIAEHKKRKAVKPVSISQELAPVFSDILVALAQIVSKELPAPLVEVAQPDVKIEVDNPITVNVPSVKDVKPPIVNIKDYDYTKLFITLKESVDKLTEAVENRPTEWGVERNSQGFIQTVKAVTGEE